MQAVEGVRHVDDAALILYGGHRIGEGHAAGDGALKEQADDLAFTGLDLLADDHAHAVALGDLPRFEASGGAVVVGDRDDVQAYLASALQDVGHGHHAVLAVM